MAYPMHVQDASGDWLEIPIREFEPGDDGVADELDINDLPEDLRELLINSRVGSLSAVSADPTSRGSTMPVPPGVVHTNLDWRLDFDRLKQPDTLAASLPVAVQRSVQRIETETSIVSQLNVSHPSAPSSRLSCITPARFSSVIANAGSLSSRALRSGLGTGFSSAVSDDLEFELAYAFPASSPPPPPPDMRPRLEDTAQLEQALNRTLDEEQIESLLGLSPGPAPGPACSAFTLSPPRGLMNVGNTCFLNAAVQALAHCVPLTAFLLQGLFVMDLNEANPDGTGCVLTMVFVALLHELFALRPSTPADVGGGGWPGIGGSLPPIPPVDFILALAQFNPMLASGEMHDAQELLGWLLDALHEDLNRVSPRPHNGCAGALSVDGAQLASEGEERYAAEAWRNHLRLNRSVIVDLFQGQLRSQLRCSRCSALSVKFDPFLHLTLPLPADDDALSLLDAVTSFCREEALDGDNSWWCAHCGRHVAAWKKLDLWKLPPILMIHLRRVEWIELPPLRPSLGWQPPNFATRKSTSLVYFSEQGVDLSPVVAGAATHKESLVYDLCAVVDHHGVSTDEGHYTATCRRPEGWCLFNDSAVDVLDFGTPVVGPNNYVLILERSSTPHSPEAIVEQCESNPQAWPHVVDVDWSFLAGTSFDPTDC